MRFVAAGALSIRGAPLAVLSGSLNFGVVCSGSPDDQSRARPGALDPAAAARRPHPRGPGGESAGDQKLPAYCVFTDATMLALAESLPEDESDLARIPGIGPAKIGKYGPSILALCAGSSLPRGPGETGEPPAAVG